jgi:SOS-response transcriptional repressor LexA
MKTIGSKIRELRERAGLTQTALAKAVGVSKAAVSQWESDETTPTGPNLVKCATILDVTAESLTRTNSANVETIMPPFHPIPLIDYVQAGQWAEIADAYQPGDGEEMLSTSGPCGPHTFGLRVKGRSMEPDYLEGDIIIVDPDVRPDPGGFVVAKLDDTEEATFKKYRPRGTDEQGVEIIDLVPLNEDFPTITLSSKTPGRIVGTVIEHRHDPRARLR